MKAAEAALQIICSDDEVWKDVMRDRIHTPQLLTLAAIIAFETQREDVYTKIVRHALLEMQGPNRVTRKIPMSNATVLSDDPQCFRCHRYPHQIGEYRDAVCEETPADFVRTEDGTYNDETNTFACTDCYMAIGCPAGPPRTRWKAPAKTFPQVKSL